MSLASSTQLRTRLSAKLRPLAASFHASSSEFMPTAHDDHLSARVPFDGSIQDYLLPIVREQGRTHLVSRPEYVSEQETYLQPGEVIAGRHVVEEWLGNQAITQIYRVRHATISTFTYILKTPRPAFSDHEEILAQFHTEASALARLRDPLTPQIIDLGTLADGRPFQCLEILPGVTLQELTHAMGAQPEPVVWHIAADILSLVAEMHSLGMTHGNLQPSTVRLWKDPSSDAVHPRLVDFGTIQTHPPEIAGQFSSGWTAQYRTLFASEYLAPDCLADRHFPTCDVYSIGLILAELLDGAPSFANEQNNMRSTLPVDRGTPSVVLGPCASQSAMYPLLARALHPDPMKRYASADEMLRALLEIVQRTDPSMMEQFSEGIFERFAPAQQNTRRVDVSSKAGRKKKRTVPAASHALGMDTARMYKVPTPANASTPRDLSETTATDAPPTFLKSLPLVMRITLIVLFMTAAFGLLFLGLPQ